MEQVEGIACRGDSLAKVWCMSPWCIHCEQILEYVVYQKSKKSWNIWIKVSFLRILSAMQIVQALHQNNKEHEH